LVQDESIFIHDSILTRKRKWIIREKRPVVTVTGSHNKTIIFGVLSLDGKQLFRDSTKDLTVNLLLHILRRSGRSLINLSYFCR